MHVSSPVPRHVHSLFCVYVCVEDRSSWLPVEPPLLVLTNSYISGTVPLKKLLTSAVVLPMHDLLSQRQFYQMGQPFLFIAQIPASAALDVHVFTCVR